MRHARQEAQDRLGGRYDVRVLEPSPPAVAEPPYLADDPLSGGDVVPVERAGARTWESVCSEVGDTALLRWCEDRWLVRGTLAALPDDFVTTRVSLHSLAEHLIVPCRHRANGKIGLRYTYHGFGTPFFAGDRQVRVEDGVLVDGDRQVAMTTLAEAADFLRIEPGAPVDVYKPTTGCDLDVPLPVDPAAGRALGDWYGYVTSLLEQLRAESTPADDCSRPQLWPEHFDVALTLGVGAARANFGGSPGDENHPEPYLYVGPFEPEAGMGDFWNEPFGASLGYAELFAGADGLDFLRKGRDLLRSR